MFKEARLKLTAWYLMIIMVISFSFSGVIYAGVNNELVRLDSMQKERQARVDTIKDYLRQNSFSLPPEIQTKNELETVEQSRIRIITTLGFINITILVISGLGGYLLAGLTLEPISKMMKEQKEFVSNASHELRTPITSLKTEIEVALRDKDMSLSVAKDLLKSNLDDVNNMQKLSNYLLKLNRFEDPETNLKIEKVNMGTIVMNVVESRTSFAKEKGIKINKKIVPVSIKGNEEAVNEITTILIDNAIKYSGKAKKIDVTTNKNGMFTVRDFGVGIAEKDLPHIFDRFYRADSSRSKEKVDGYGLGLSIAKSIADKMGVKIKVQSKLGKGSTFSLQFLV